MQEEQKQEQEASLEMGGCCGGRKKKKARDEGERRDLISRLNRMEGQIRGIRNMLLEERYCVDILTQVSSVSSALKAFSKELLQKDSRYKKLWELYQTTEDWRINK